MASIANYSGELFSPLFTRGIGMRGLAVLLLESCVCSAGQVERLFITHSDGGYRLEIVSVLDAPAQYAYDVITDYQHAYRINPSIVEINVLPADHEGTVRVYNRSEHCVGPFCFNIDWTGDITSSSPGQIEVVTIPEQSSFESGHAVWRIRSQGEGTFVQYALSLKPKFFIPPLIGDKIMESRIREETLATFQRIECHARLLFELDLEQKPEELRKLLSGRDECIRLDS